MKINNNLDIKFLIKLLTLHLQTESQKHGQGESGWAYITLRRILQDAFPCQLEIG